MQCNQLPLGDKKVDGEENLQPKAGTMPDPKSQLQNMQQLLSSAKSGPITDVK